MSEYLDSSATNLLELPDRFRRVLRPGDAVKVGAVSLMAHWGEPPAGIMAEVARRIQGEIEREQERCRSTLLERISDTDKTTLFFGNQEQPIRPAGSTAVERIVNEVRFVKEKATTIACEEVRRAFEAKLETTFAWADEPATTTNDTLTLANLAEAVSRIQPPIWYTVSDYLEPGAYIIVAGIVAQYFSCPDYLIIHSSQVDGFWADARASRVWVRPLSEWVPGMPFAKLATAARALRPFP